MRRVSTPEEKMSYDTKEGIEVYLDGGLQGLNKLEEDRRLATYGKGPNPCKLREWLVLGRYVLGACGNFSGITKGAPADMPDRGIWPRVIALDEAARHGNFSYSSGIGVPRHDKVCTYCGHGWSIHNCHDNTRDNSEEVVDLKDYIGKTILEMRDLLPQPSTHVVYWRNDSGIRNDAFIDLSTDPEYPALKVNELGWVKGALPNDYIIQKGDQGFVYRYGWIHKHCGELRKINDITKGFTKVFRNAGYENFGMSIIPNRYCPCKKCAPWFRVSTFFGDIEIGWGKRVINIDWRRTSLKAAPDFSKEDVNQGANFIHAWGYEKAETYLRTLRVAAAGEAGE